HRQSDVSVLDRVLTLNSPIDAMESRACFIDQRRRSRIRVLDGDVRIGKELIESRAWYVRGGEALKLRIARPERPDGDPAFLGFQVVGIGQDLILSKPGWDAEYRESLTVTLDHLRRRNHVCSVGKPGIEQVQGDGVDIRAVTRDTYSAIGAI